MAAAGSPAGSSASGVTGSIAAYKAVELLRLLRAEGADVVGHADAVRDPVRRAAVVRGAVAPPGRDRRARPAARRPDRPHRRRRHGRRDRRRARRPRTGSARWPTAWPATSSPRRASRRPRRSSSRRRWTATCGRHPATAANVARLRDDFGYTVVEPETGPLASGQIGVGRLAELAAIVDAVVAAVGGSAGPRRRIRPRVRPLRRPGPRRRPRRPARRRHRRRHARADRPGPLHRQSLDRPDGRRRSPRPRSTAARG